MSRRDASKKTVPIRFSDECRDLWRGRGHGNAGESRLRGSVEVHRQLDTVTIALKPQGEASAEASDDARKLAAENAVKRE
jgi:hypothetical protein